MAKKNSIINVFPQHVVPDELSILSVYEILIYLLILFGCWFLYNRWNEIPVIRQDIQVERLDSINRIHCRSLVDLDYDIPVSSKFPRDYVVIRTMTDPNTGEKMRQGFFNRELDSLKKIYLHHFPDSLPGLIGPLFYVKQMVYQDRKSVDYHITTMDSSFRNKLSYEEKYYQNGHAAAYTQKPYYTWLEFFLNGVKIENTTKANYRPLVTPSFFSLRDISQAYYEFRVISHSVHDVNLNLAFVGAAECTPTRPTGKDDIVEMRPGGIGYKLKYFPDNEKIIRLHVKYKDQENSQARRVFLVTSVLSGLITIFIAFLIIFIYKILRSLVESKKKGIGNGESNT